MLLAVGPMALLVSGALHTVAVLPHLGEPQDDELTAQVCTAVSRQSWVSPSCIRRNPFPFLPGEWDRAQEVLTGLDKTQSLDACSLPVCFRVYGELADAGYLVVTRRAGHTIQLELMDTRTGKPLRSVAQTYRSMTPGESPRGLSAQVTRLLAPLKKKRAAPVKPRLLKSTRGGARSSTNPTPQHPREWLEAGRILASSTTDPGGVVRVAWDLRGRKYLPTAVEFTLQAPAGKITAWCVAADGSLKPTTGSCRADFPPRGESRFTLPLLDRGIWQWSARGYQQDANPVLSTSGFIAAGVGPTILMEQVRTQVYPAATLQFTPKVACAGVQHGVRVTWTVVPQDGDPTTSTWKTLHDGPCEDATLAEQESTPGIGTWWVMARLTDATTSRVLSESIQNVQVKAKPKDKGVALNVVVQPNAPVDAVAVRQAIMARATQDGIPMMEANQIADSAQAQDVSLVPAVYLEISVSRPRQTTTVLAVVKSPDSVIMTQATASRCTEDPRLAQQLSVDVAFAALAQAGVRNAKPPGQPLMSEKCSHK